MPESRSAESLDEDARTAALRNVNACQQMADLCSELLQIAPELTAREFLRTMGALVAGIDLGVMGFKQLARGGANGLAGAGLRPEYDDGTAGQARHFAGTAAAVALVGHKPAELLAHHVVDPADSIDGHLSTAALEFAHLLIGGELPLEQAGSWIEANVCDPDFVTVTGSTPFDVDGDGTDGASVLRALFSEDEWRALTELPEQVTLAAALSEATGDFDDMRDLIAGIRSIDKAATSTSALVRAIVAERSDEGFAWDRDDRSPDELVEQTLVAVHEQLAILRTKKISVEDITAYAHFLLTVANMAVRGSRSGGIFRIGGQTVSTPEAFFLSRLEDILEEGLPGCEDCLF